MPRPQIPLYKQRQISNNNKQHNKTPLVNSNTMVKGKMSQMKAQAIAGIPPTNPNQRDLNKTDSMAAEQAY